MEIIYSFETDSESGVFGTFILRRVRELYGVDSYVNTIPMYAERLGMNIEELKQAVRGEILPDTKIIRDMMQSETMRLEVSHMYRIHSTDRHSGYKVE